MPATDQPRSGPWQRPLAAALVLLGLLSGLVPALHHHGTAEAHCHEIGGAASKHLETLGTAPHEACGLCASSLSFGHLDHQRARLAFEAMGEWTREGLRALPPGPPGHLGNPRAPPFA